MAKKSRRARKSARKVSRPVSAAPTVVVSTAAAPVAKVTAEVAAEPATDHKEYAYVVADIRQVAILAGAMFALLIVLSFFLG